MWYILSVCNKYETQLVQLQTCSWWSLAVGYWHAVLLRPPDEFTECLPDLPMKEGGKSSVHGLQPSQFLPASLVMEEPWGRKWRAKFQSQLPLESKVWVSSTILLSALTIAFWSSTDPLNNMRFPWTQEPSGWAAYTAAWAGWRAFSCSGHDSKLAAF